MSKMGNLLLNISLFLFIYLPVLLYDHSVPIYYNLFLSVRLYRSVSASLPVCLSEDVPIFV